MSILSRRSFIGSTALTLALAPRLAFARAATNKRFIFIIQRGAADGLATLMPIGDPAFAALRPGEQTGAKLDATFALHPALAETAKLYAAKEALFGHALGLTFKDRSHFDAQNVLETGGMAAYAEKTGWMNRLLGLLPDTSALAVAPAIPMALRGDVQVATYAPSNLPAASDDLLARVGALYEADAQLGPLWTSAMATRTLAGDLSGNNGRNGAATGELAARLMAPADGARVVMIETGGWDTHSGQRARLANQLKGLDAMIAALKTGLGPSWSDMMVLIATEFGRTAALNGTGGTDHGTASAAMLLGGAVQGGRIVTDWPGLASSALYEGRDLKPTMQLEAFIAGALASHFALDPARVARAVYPAIAGLKPPEGFARA